MGKLGRLTSFGINHNIPTTWRWARGEFKKKILQMKCINIFFQGNTFALIEAEAFVCSTFKKTTTTYWRLSSWPPSLSPSRITLLTWPLSAHAVNALGYLLPLTRNWMFAFHSYPNICIQRIPECLHSMHTRMFHIVLHSTRRGQFSASIDLVVGGHGFSRDPLPDFFFFFNGRPPRAVPA